MATTCKAFQGWWPKSEKAAYYMKSVSYASASGLLMYAMLATRPNIAHVLGIVSRYMAHPRRAHMNALQSILRYLKGIRSKCLCCEKGPLDLYSIIYDSGMAEAEYTSATKVSKEAIWLACLCNEFSLPNKAQVVACDSKSTLCLTKNVMFHACTKNIDMHYYFTREGLEDGFITLIKVNTSQNSEHALANESGPSGGKKCTLVTGKNNFELHLKRDHLKSPLV
ncbi:hypothetical protein KP509_02G019600 [Ceratopteris richardii]|uniref:Retrovirus-related Pol polyprotein from transposon TNT 1-94 n=1 Tax=Ceratopteris richardii TaxID=49495 RepID=A0A8T2V3P6_CERRI|nr:hypothetical protein KP509_02G019600 [Ceratopteris richardii]